MLQPLLLAVLIDDYSNPHGIVLCRVVNVSSLLHKGGRIDFEDLDGTKKNIPPRGFMHPGYANSKLANVYHTIELANRLKGSGVDAYVLSPGFCYTGLMRNVSWTQFLLMSPILFFFTRSAWSVSSHRKYFDVKGYIMFNILEILFFPRVPKLLCTVQQKMV